jgi:dihydroxyacetone kinase-like predicted kinase
MRRETIEIDERFGKEYAGKYVFQEITWAKRNRILQMYTKYNPQTGSVVTTDYVAIQAETILASVKEQPESKSLTLEKLLSEGEDGIPIELGELLSKIVNKLNAVSVEETKNS